MDPRILVLMAALCSPSGQQCQDKEIANSDTMPALNDMYCNYHGQMLASDWVLQHRGYEGWRVGRYGCIRIKSGERPIVTWRF